ncbi:cyclic nucleotide-binding domain-containing protein [Amphritea sp. 1_MG-2023]|uniref:Crp/Fnr family transcriptional regulator n=1 Tax=Amphritea sp. 1_MG-2023 TaxID=3062670 RepID=UPI0026E1E429|nr:cyclic nucleotide-binding domain-containing protein [Amphritea sp. 1_MG-2023]MDO6564237.1 cyclic nucleotide-binding domain-containing protein [Amphritea sp. 1_MG-2023]
METITTQTLLTRCELSQLVNASVFGALSETAIVWLLDHGVIRRFDPGDLLFSPAQPGDSFHVILQGRVDYYKFHNGRYAYIRSFSAGEQVGFVSLIALHDRVGRAEACEPCVSLEINSAVFHEFHLNKPLEFGILLMNLTREMARTLRNTNNILVDRY